ncbi:MAG: DNA polymerase III subunit delta' [Oscillospiraceae bacterium]|nr:DNA polymerase III subunit delta' [Oscillospiraceae bacterium]
MEFTQSPAAARIREAAARGTLSHAMLFTGSGDRLSAARYTAAALECTADGGRPCGTCAACRKVLADIHPDVITVRDDEHKEIGVDVIRQVRADAYIQPNEGARKVYLFPDCAILNERDQNVLLKIVEEGPPYAAFLFCAENSAAVLQTLRSRCVEIKLQPERRETPELSDACAALCHALSRQKRGALSQLTVRLEKKKLSRDDLAALLAQCQTVCSAALLRQYGYISPEGEGEPAQELAARLNKTQLMHSIEIFKKYCGDCSYNVGQGHVLGALAAELEETL